MTEEEYFRKTYPDSCYGNKPLSPYWDFFQDGVEFGERQSEKKITDLEETINKLREQFVLRYDLEDKLKKENAELVKTAETFQTTAYKLSDRLTNAIGIIKRWYETNRSTCIEPSQELIEVTEQFIKEIEK